MSRENFYHNLFADEVLFRIPADNVQGERVEAVQDLPLTASSGLGGSEMNRERDNVDLSPFKRLKTRVLIVVNTYGKGIKPEELAFLSKVLKAVNYNLEEVDLFELEKLESSDASVVLSGQLADYVLLFGVKPETLQLSVNLELYEPKNKDGVWLLMSNSLLRIEMEESRRRDLWKALKAVFLQR